MLLLLLSLVMSLILLLHFLSNKFSKQNIVLDPFFRFYNAIPYVVLLDVLLQLSCLSLSLFLLSQFNVVYAASDDDTMIENLQLSPRQNTNVAETWVHNHFPPLDRCVTPENHLYDSLEEFLRESGYDLAKTDTDKSDEYTCYNSSDGKTLIRIYDNCNVGCVRVLLSSEEKCGRNNHQLSTIPGVPKYGYLVLPKNK